MAIRALVVVCVTALALAAVPALAQQNPPPREPILRIDPGMHTTVIRRVGVDLACTLLATASEDKTVRLWRLPDGALMRTLRPPIGPGDDGKLRGVAMAPDGSWIAAGGWSSDGFHFVYIFQSATGAMTARLGPFGAEVRHLTVSADGRHLAATLGGGQGLRVWARTGADPARWALVAEDRDYGGEPSHGAGFDRTGVLYTVAYDGKLRRYVPNYQAPPTWVATRGDKPNSVSVHPSGDRVAVGHSYIAGGVHVHDASTLSWLFAPDTKNVSGTLGSVAWSNDGARLYGGGQFNKAGRHQIRVWERSGEGQASDLDGPQNTVTHLLACGEGMAMTAAGPAFALFASDGSRRLWREGVEADLRGQHGAEDISGSADGRRFRFGLEVQGKSPVLFDLAAEQLSEAPTRPNDLNGADTTSLPVTGWLNSFNPKLAGVPIKLDQYEKSRSLAIGPDRQRFVLGAESSLRAFDKDAKELWRKELPSVAWGVNISRDGRLVVAAHGDGTVRWHRLSDGEELLSLFVHKVDRRWVTWTPRGYYMASPGAESFIGWHVNRGWDEAAHFFPVDRFRDQFNRPDIVKLVLETLDETKAIEHANKRANVKRAVEDVRAIAPPMIVIQRPGDGSSFRTPEVTLEYDIFSPTGEEITSIDVRINNAAQGARSAMPFSAGTYTSGRITVTLPREDTTVTLIARQASRVSEPISIRLRWDGAKPGQVVLPRLRALFVGVNAYTSPKLTKLQFAVKDATDLAAFFTAQEGKTYGKVEAKVLPDAKRTDTINALEWLEKHSEKDDINLLFLAGHGATIDQHFYYMTADSNPDEARATALSRDEILRTIRNRKGAMVVMLDTCHSGASADAKTPITSRVDMHRLANEIGDKSLGVLLYASASGRQLSYEHPDWQNGAFTRAMLDGLAGAADRDKVGYVDTEELSVYVRRRVMAMTKDRQTPVRMKPDAEPEMRIVLLR